MAEGPLRAESLSVLLKAQTASQHAQVEDLLGLPAAIRDRPDYARWLGRFLGFYEPLESVLARVAHPDGFGPVPFALHSDRLTEDLRSLGVDPSGPPRVAAGLLPSLPTLAHVAGSRYVLIGATLGGRHILHGLEPRLKAGLGAATRFLDGGGRPSASIWLDYRRFLDDFGNRHPELRADVVRGAVGTFAAFHRWFVPFCDGRGRSQ